MREELIIDGQQVDLGSETSITLEYVSNLLNDPGKISLSHSYTLKLPRTANNARILDLPEIPAHDSSKTRRYLPALYLRNGINLIGDNAHAYITSATDEQYELVLVWDDIPELRELSESDATINDLPNLPRLRWVGNSYGSESQGALFARYTSSNVPKDTTTVNDLIHPCMRMRSLMERVLHEAGLSYTMPDGALQNVVTLAAPSHKPDTAMNQAAGVFILGHNDDEARNAYFTNFNATTAILQFPNSVVPSVASVPVAGDYLGTFQLTEGYRSCHVSVGIMFSGYTDLSDDCTLRIYPVGNDMRLVTSVVMGELPIISVPGGYACVGDLYIEMPEGFDQFMVCLHSDTDKRLGAYAYSYGGSDYIIWAYVDREKIDVSFENIFPLEGNLPDIQQWDFMRNSMLIGGLVPVVNKTTLHLHDVAHFADLTRAADWTERVNMSEPPVVKPSLSGDWAQRNQLRFAENQNIKTDKGFSLYVHDETQKASRDWSSLDFAASLGDSAAHYKSKDSGATYEDVDIKPRFFKYDSATQSLQFTPDLYGEGLKAKYAALQEAIEKPVVIEATVRLTEMDLATLDLTRPVYLAQFGRYYHVLKVQTGKTDDCKVELLQIK